MFTNKKREGINTFVCTVSLYVVETTKASIKDHEPSYPYYFSALSRTVLLDNLSRNSCICLYKISDSTKKIFPTHMLVRFKCYLKLCGASCRENLNKHGLVGSPFIFTSLQRKRRFV